ncbi:MULTISPECIES: hypothetical protein [unclassified Microcoleus]|uniref:hypothetical protein n=1 Tax=unclassified Microcoleus TaxID=2642155 RepID=UPI00312B837F
MIDYKTGDRSFNELWAIAFLNRAEKWRSLFPISDYKITGCVRLDKKWQNLP